MNRRIGPNLNMMRLPYRSGLELHKTPEGWAIEWNPRRQLGILIPAFLFAAIIIGPALTNETNETNDQSKAFVLLVVFATLGGFALWITGLIFKKNTKVITCEGNQVIVGSVSMDRQDLVALVIEKERYRGGARDNYCLLLKSGERIHMVSVESLQFGQDPFQAFANHLVLDVVRESIRTDNA